MKILYICPDLGIPVLGRKGASVHVRELVAAFGRAGHSVVLAAPLLNKSPWEEPAELEAQLLHAPPAPDVVSAFYGLKAFNETLGIEDSLPGELRRILYDQDLAVASSSAGSRTTAPDFIYERASLYSTAGVSLARELERPLDHRAELAAGPGARPPTGPPGSEIWLRGRNAGRSRAPTRCSPSRLHCVTTRCRSGQNPDRVHVVPNGVNAEPVQAGRARPGGHEALGAGRQSRPGLRRGLEALARGGGLAGVAGAGWSGDTRTCGW